MQRINLFPNPDLNPNGTGIIINGVTATMQNKTLTVTAAQTVLDIYALMIVSNLTPGSTLTFSTDETSALADGYPIVSVLDTKWSQLSILSRSSGQRIVGSPFTVPDDGLLRILFYPYRHDDAADASGTHVFTRPQLELASTYNSNEQGLVGGVLQRIHHAARLTRMAVIL